jgi:hypothetical protein
MPRFFFQYRNGHIRAEDPEGSELPDLDAARAEAGVALREFVAERFWANQPPGNPQFEIYDEAGRLLALVSPQSCLSGER